jgi:hypothetical protein
MRHLVTNDCGLAQSARKTREYGIRPLGDDIMGTTGSNALHGFGIEIMAQVRD